MGRNPIDKKIDNRIRTRAVAEIGRDRTRLSNELEA